MVSKTLGWPCSTNTLNYCCHSNLPSNWSPQVSISTAVNFKVKLSFDIQSFVFIVAISSVYFRFPLLSIQEWTYSNSSWYSLVVSSPCCSLLVQCGSWEPDMLSFNDRVWVDLFISCISACLRQASLDLNFPTEDKTSGLAIRAWCIR